MTKKRKKTERPLTRPVDGPGPNPKRGSFLKRPAGGLHILAVILLVAAGIAAYANSFSVPFHFDDRPHIVENPDIQVKVLSLDRLLQLVRNSYRFGIRFFPYATFALNYYIGRLDVFGYHLVNLLVHVVSGILIFCLLLLTLNLPCLKERYGSIAFPVALISSLLFIVHPIQTQAVTYIVQRMASMAAMFYLLSLFLYVKGRLCHGGRRFPLWMGAFLSYFLALFSKENAAILPLFVGLYEFYFFRNFTLSPREKKTWIHLLTIVVLLGVVGSILFGRHYFTYIIEGHKDWGFTLGERVLTQFRVVLYYITLLIYPHPARLNLDYDFPVSHGIFDPPVTFFAILIVVAILIYSIRAGKKQPLLSFAILWYFGNLLIESSIFPLEMVYEHRLYLPAVGPFLLFTLLLVRAWDWGKGRVPKSETLWVKKNIPLWAAVFLIVVVFSVGTYLRNTVWSDPIALWQDSMKKSPRKARVHVNLGYYLVKAGQFSKGIETLRTAIHLDPNSETAYLNLGLAHMDMKLFDGAFQYLEGYLRLKPNDPEGYNEIALISLEKKKTEEAIQFLKKGLEIGPNVAKLHANLGNVYLQTGMYGEAVREYKRALQLNLNQTVLHVKLAEAYEKIGQSELAMEEIRKVLEEDPSIHEAYVALGARYLREGRTEEAVVELNKALKLNPKDPHVYNNLGIAFRRKNLPEQAIQNYRKAVTIDPSFSEARINLGEIYAQKGMMEEAIVEFRSALDIDPSTPEAHNNLGVIFLQTKRFDEAISSLKRAVVINPKYGEALFNLAVAHYYKKDVAGAAAFAKKALDQGYDVDPRLLKLLRMQQ